MKMKVMTKMIVMVMMVDMNTAMTVLVVLMMVMMKMMEVRKVLTKCSQLVLADSAPSVLRHTTHVSFSPPGAPLGSRMVTLCGDC